MSEYSMPSYFQTMPVIGKELVSFHEDNAAEIQAVEQEARVDARGDLIQLRFHLVQVGRCPRKTACLQNQMSLTGR